MEKIKRFIHLRVKTEFNLLNSLVFTESLSQKLKQNSFLACGLMDFANLSAGMQFSYHLKKNGIKPIIGMSLPVFNENFEDVSEIGLIAKNENGYSNLLNILYQLNFHSIENDKRFHLDKLKEYSEDLICLTGSRKGYINKIFKNNGEKEAERELIKLQNIFKNDLFIELGRYGFENEQEDENFLINCAEKINIPFVATNEILFINRGQFEAFDALSCVKNKEFVSSLDREVLNSEFNLKTEEEMIDLFSDIPEAIENTVNIARKCSFFIKEKKPRLPSFNLKITNENEAKILEELTKKGLESRIKEIKDLYEIEDEIYWKRLEFELAIITKMEFSGYFLVVSDFINWAKNNKISVGPGRGSGAGSIVAWALKITGLDPIKYSLLFERFLNPDRISMPDFDIDFCQTRREEVINYVRQKYGDLRVANIVTYGKMNAKTAIKDIGRVLHVPYVKLDEISKMIPFNPLEQITIKKALEMDKRFREQKENDEEINQLINIATEVEGLIRHSSIHAAGIIISNEEIQKIAPVEKSEEGISIIAYDMKDAEKIGMVKFDFLGLKTLSVISQIVDTLKEKNIELNIEKIKTDDKKTFELLRSANLKGIFQFEAVIPRITLKKIHTDKIEDLMAITSLARPGPMSNIPTYIRRKTGEEPVKYYHSALEESLKETFGIIIYQEQVMQVVQILGGYSLGEADIVRKAMGKKIQSEMELQKDIFIKKAIEKGIIDKNEAIEMFEIIAKFAGYGFNRAHAASYALISYQTAYLKAHYPLEFFIANLNLEIGDTDKINFFIIDCKLFGVKVLTPSVNKSNVYFKEENQSIRYGLAGLKAVGENSASQICKEREKGEFLNLEDFISRCKEYLNKRNLEAFILSGALEDFGFSRKALFENVERILNYEKETSGASLFSDDQSVSGLLIENVQEFNQDELLKYEFEFFGFYFSSHPLEEKKTILLTNNIILSTNIEEEFAEKNEATFYISGVVVKFIQRFKKNARFAFLHMVDFEGMYEVMIFNDKLIEKHINLLQEGKTMILQIDGKNNLESGLKLLVKDIISIDDFIKKEIDFDFQEKKTNNRKTPEQKNIEESKKNEMKTENKIITKTLTIKCEKSSELIEIESNLKNGIYKNYDNIVIQIGDTTIKTDVV